MHEFAIANSVLDAVRTEARLRPGMRVAKIGVRIGDLAGLDPDALSFCFEALVRKRTLSPSLSKSSIGRDGIAARVALTNLSS
jgi:hydrogenase nickel incorporation protein HypA/HybF